MDFRQMDFKLLSTEIKKLQKTVKISFDFSYTNYEGHKTLVKIHEVLLSNIKKNEDILRLYETLIKLNYNSVTQEAFNEIIDLRPYLLNSPKDYTQECLHYLGDAAQKWWFEKKFMERYEKVMKLIDSENLSKAFEEYLKFETVERYRKIVQELKEQYDSSYLATEEELSLILSGFLSILSLSKKLHLK